jgi:transposase
MPYLVDDQFWQLLEPLLPRPRHRYRHPGRKRLDDRRVLAGIVFVLTTGIPWQRLPQELGYGSGMTCWRRLHEWQQAGVFQRLHQHRRLRIRYERRADIHQAFLDLACSLICHRQLRTPFC